MDDPTPLTLFTLDPSGVVLTIRGNLPPLRGQSSIGKGIFDLLEHHRLDQYREIFQRALVGANISTTIETEYGLYDLHLLPAHGPDGTLTGVHGIAHDANERRRFETALRQSEEHYRSMIATLAEGVTVVDADGMVLAANEAAQRILGIPLEELVGRSIDYFAIRAINEEGAPFPPDELPIAKTFRTGQSQANVVMGFQRSDGELTWVSVNTQPVWGADPERPEAVVSSFLDITGRKRDAETLRRSEQRTRKLLEAIPDLMLIVSADGTFLDYQANSDNQLLIPRERVIGSGIWDLPLPDELKHVGLRAVRRALATGEPQTMEYSFEAIEGYYEARFTALDDEQVLVLVRDISERKRAEFELQRRINVLAALQKVDDDLTKSLDMDYALVVALDTAVTMSGASAGFVAVLEGDEIRYERTTPGYPSLKDERSRRVLSSGLFARALASRETVLVDDVQLEPGHEPLRPDTRAMLLLPLVSHETLVGLLGLENDRVGAFRNQTEFMELLAARIAVALDNARLYQVTRQQLGELQALYTQVKELEQLKTHMIRVAAHDLRNPLGVIAGYLTLLEGELGQDEKYRRYFETMNRAVRRMEQMTSDVLSLERIHAVQTKALELYDLRAAIQRAEADFSHEIEAKGLRLQLHVPAHPVVVEVDPVQIYEALTNLLSNAIKYTLSGGSITLSLWVENGRAVLDVADTGIGIPENQQGQLFQPFFRVKTLQTQAIDGTGLGLYLVKSIVERHHGTVRFHSVEGQGSTFGFELPLFEPVGNR